MPLPNRVTPFGELVAEPARGCLFGNRGGRFHDPATRTLRTRRWASKQWICCALDFKGRRRTVWATGYTELFFLDEITALAAGHRPCCECRRAAARGFQAALAAAGGQCLSLAEIDVRLHAERLDGRAKRLHRAPAGSLPDGAMIAIGGDALAVRGDAILPWSLDGYGAPQPRPSGIVNVLTPPLTLAALAGGYAPLWHPTAPHRSRGGLA
jgi:hypothetical protein